MRQREAIVAWLSTMSAVFDRQHPVFVFCCCYFVCSVFIVFNNLATGDVLLKCMLLLYTIPNHDETTKLRPLF